MSDIPAPLARSARIKAIIAEIAASHRMSADDIVGSSRMHYVVAARHEAIRMVASEFPSMVPSQIAKAFVKDHATVRYVLGMSKRKPKPHAWATLLIHRVKCPKCNGTGYVLGDDPKV